MEERYQKFYETGWEETYGFWHKIIDRGQEQIKILIKLINETGVNPIKILDVGCGEGDEISQVLSQIKNKDFKIVANDTSKEALDKYKRNNFSYIKHTINEKLENLPRILKEKFDIILFSHCLYGVNLDNLFNQYLGLLKEQGIILIFLDSEESGIKKIQSKFWNQIHNVPFDENVAEDIINNLSLNHINHEVIEIPYYIYLNNLEKIKVNGLASLFIPFAFRTKDIKKEIVNKIVFYIKTLEHTKKIKNKTFAIIIRKAQLNKQESVRVCMRIPPNLAECLGREKKHRKERIRSFPQGADIPTSQDRFFPTIPELLRRTDAYVERLRYESKENKQGNKKAYRGRHF